MASTTPRPRRRPLSNLPVRTRVLTSMVLVSLLVLVLAGGAAYLLQRIDTHRSIDDSLERSAVEFIRIAETSTDPQTGESWRSADRLIYSAMMQTMLAENESMVALREGEVTWTPNERQPVRLDEDPEFLQWVQDQAPITERSIRTVQTEESSYRAVILPVLFPEDRAETLFVLAADTDAEMVTLNRTFATYSGVGVGALAVAALLGWLTVGRMLYPVRRLRETAQSITETDISGRIEVTSHDDLGELTVTVNAMLDRLESAVVSQRRLLDDVGHELRTPLTIVRGHLELVDPEDRDDVLAVRELSLDELDRMGRLVEDMLTLAKSEQRDFLSPAPTDVAALTRQVAEHAAQLGNRQWRTESAAEATVPLDAQRITQAWLQLAHNAVRFSQEGSEIALGSAINRRPDGGSRLDLWVQDAGAGIAEADRERIFERFARGAEAPRAEGSGLGLTIVANIVAGHGGEIRVDSVPGAGSRFTMQIPYRVGSREPTSQPTHPPSRDPSAPSAERP
ncbi:sensor histidine kinase [Nesterenkonia aerolata]|uniref:histidine kinase n=1 Tax=Nesterenkonia aerolata TaxID=3074079 RepID=A0ABU2DS94_9MICC|nr:ATP-binding protein [Nesterenkonia sp. LY-0111]MDR8019372.1 ATP-binding protein [Nesterenkonia sp. LY-0111]